MLRPATTAILAFALGVLPVVHDVCGPECEMGEAPVIVAAAADGLAPEGGDTECPLHPVEEKEERILSDPPKAPVHQEDGCTHDHGSVREAPQSPSALAPSAAPLVALPVATFSWTAPHVVADGRGHAVVLPPLDRAPQVLALRV